jgi:PKD repeat protein
MCSVLLNAQNTSDFIPTGLIDNSINAPGRMAVDTDDNVYATDAIQNTIVKYDKQGNYLATIPTDFYPISIAISNNNRLFVGDKLSGNIYEVAQAGEKKLFYAGCTLPNSMVFGLNVLYIIDSKQKKVIGLDVSGDVVTDFTYDTFTFPTGIAFDKQNNHIIVAEHGGVGEDVQSCGGGGSMSWGTTGPLTTIYIFDLDGGLINNFGCFGTGNGLFHRIQGITVGACGNIYAADPYLGRISVFDSNGNYITKFGTQGDNPGEFNLPVDIAFTSDNRAFVSSMNKGAIDVFEITQTLPTATITSPDQTVCSLSDAVIEVELTGTAPWTFNYTINGEIQTEITTSENPYTISATSTGLYEVSDLIDGTGTMGTCLTGGTYITESIPPTATILTNELSKCSSDDSSIEVQFTGIAPWKFTYTIDGLNPTEISTTSDTYTLKAEQSGLYEIIELSDDGCQGTDVFGTANVTIHPLPTATIISDVFEIFVNPGEYADVNIAFTGSAPFTLTYLKDEVDLISISTNDNPYNLSVAEEGTYEIMTIADSYCSNNEWQGYFDLIINDIVLPTATINTKYIEVCEGNSDNIVVDFTGLSPWTFSYTVDGFDPIEIVTSDNPYQLITSVQGFYELSAVTDVNNIPGIYSGTAQVIELLPPVVDLGPDIYMCEGDDIYTLDAGEFESYLWNTGSTNRTIEVSSPGTYSVTVTNASGCSATGFVTASVSELPTAAFFYDIDRSEVQFISSASNATSHYWEFGDGGSSTEENPIHIYKKKGTHTVTYTAGNDHCGAVQTTQAIKVVSTANKKVMAIYPNPSYGDFTLKIKPEEPIRSDIEVLIRDFSGEVIFHQVYNPYELTQYNGSMYVNIRLSNFTKHIYLVDINAENFEGRDKLILKD